jgi:hypothetical protein
MHYVIPSLLLYVGNHAIDMFFPPIPVYIRVLRSFSHFTNISSEMLLVTSGKVIDYIYIDIESNWKYYKQLVLWTLSWLVLVM